MTYGLKLVKSLTRGSFIGILPIMKYLIITHKSKYGYDVRVPALPGCHSQGNTKKEALDNIRDAILTYLEMDRAELKGAKIGEVEVAFV